MRGFAEKQRMKRILVLADAAAVAKEAAKVIAAEARWAVAARGRFIVAVSGGRTPWQMLRALAGEDVPWNGSACGASGRTHCPRWGSGP